MRFLLRLLLLYSICFSDEQYYLVVIFCFTRVIEIIWDCIPCCMNLLLILLQSEFHHLVCFEDICITLVSILLWYFVCLSLSVSLSLSLSVTFQSFLEISSCYGAVIHFYAIYLCLVSFSLGLLSYCQIHLCIPTWCLISIHWHFWILWVVTMYKYAWDMIVSL